MRTTYAVILCVLLLLFSACAQKVNDPADVQAIKDTGSAWDKAYNAANAEALASGYYTADAVRMEPYQAAIGGKDAIRTSLQKYFDQYADEGRTAVEDVRVSGDLAIARGTAEGKSSLKVGGDPAPYKAKWVTAYQRQPDGSWKSFWDIWNSDLPAADSLPVGVEEQALMQMERDWGEALIKKDIAALDKILANEFQANYVDLVGNKKQFLSALKSNTFKYDSMVNSEMKAVVFGDRAVVNGLSTEKSSMAGKDTSGQYRWTDVFVKREGRWQCVTGYGARVQ
jgi:uncharacterized protein (TIGR02246 family)